MAGKRATLNNSVYAEILYKIADRKVYPTRFVEEFRNSPDDWDETNIVGSNIAHGFGEPGDEDEERFGFKWEKEKYRKSVPTLYRQLIKLHEEGFLLIEETQEGGTKHHYRNRKFFSINWEKIAEEFAKKAIQTQERRINNEKKPWPFLLEELEMMKKPSYLEKAKKNRVVQSFFKGLFTEIRQGLYYHRTAKKEKNDIVLNELFDILIEYEALNDFQEQFDEEIGLADARYEKKKELEKKYSDKNAGKSHDLTKKEFDDFVKSFISRTIGKEYVGDYEFFKRFCNDIQSPMNDDKKFILEAVKEGILFNVLSQLNESFATDNTRKKLESLSKK